MNKRKALFALIMVCALCLMPMFGATKVSADVVAPVTSTSVRNGVVVTDGVDLSEADREAITQKMSMVAETTGLDMVVYICKDLATTGKSSAQAAADDYYDYNGFGEDGVLFLWLVDEQTAHISTTKGTAARILYDNAQSNIWADMQNAIKSGDYVSAFNTFGNDVLNYYAEYNEDVASQRNAGPKYGLSGIIAVIVGALSGLIRGSSLKGQLKSVEIATSASDYIKKDSFRLTRSGEVFLYRKVDRKRRETNPEDKSSAMHTSSSGEQHGGNTFK